MVCPKARQQCFVSSSKRYYTFITDLFCFYQVKDVLHLILIYLFIIIISFHVIITYSNSVDAICNLHDKNSKICKGTHIKNTCNSNGNIILIKLQKIEWYNKHINITNYSIHAETKQRPLITWYRAKS